MLMFKDGKYHFYKGEQANDVMIEDDLINTQFMDYWLKSKNKNSIPVISTSEESEQKDSNYVDINDYQFYDDASSKVEKVVIELNPIRKNDSVSKEEKETFKLPRQEIYNINFTTDYVVSQVDNSFLNQSYQRFTGTGYQSSGFNALIKFGLNEKEQTDFITYWAPRINQKQFAAIQFLIDEDYSAEIGTLMVNPKPDCVRRVYLLFAGLDQPVESLQSNPKKINPIVRKGLTVIEWGGSELNLNIETSRL